MEEIKQETETLRINCSSETTKLVLLKLIVVLSEELMFFHKQNSNPDDFRFFKSLQRVRVKFAKTLALLCSAYKIDLSKNNSDLATFVLEHAYRPRG